MSSQVLKFLAATMLIGSLILIMVAFRLGQTPQPPGGTGASATTAPEALPEYRIVTATRPIRAGETIDAADVSLSPVASPPPGAITSTAETVGKQPMTGIARGSPLLQSHFPSGGVLVHSLGEDERAVAVKVDELIGVGGFLRPGDRVDIIVYLRGEGQQIKENQAMIILHSVRVLAYGDDLPGKAGETGAAASGDTPKSAKGRSTAVLAVKTPDATRLTFAENAGALRLALRPALAMEGNAEDPYPVTTSEFSAPPARPVPEEKAKGPRIEIYRGTRLEPVQFP